MKRFLVFLVALSMAVSLTACAGTSGGATKVKCPACGHEFTTPASGGM